MRVFAFYFGLMALTAFYGCNNNNDYFATVDFGIGNENEFIANELLIGNFSQPNAIYAQTGPVISE